MHEVSTGRRFELLPVGVPAMSLEQVALSNSHWSVFNLQEIPGNEELTGTDLKHYLSHYSIYYLIFILGFKIRRERTIRWNKKKRKKQYIEDFELANSDPNGEEYQSANSSL